MEAVHVAELHAPVGLAGRLELVARDLLDLEVAHQRVADGLLLGAVVLQAGEQPVGGEDCEPGVLERAQEHQHVAVLALAADLLGVHAGGLVAVVAVGDQQLGAGQRRLQRRDCVGVPIRQSVFCVPSWSAASANGSPVGGRLEHGRAARRRSPNRLKMGERLARVARVSARRSSFGPGWVRSCGRIRPGP